jgi:ectoine hydroxylase-related dioxygenase (phytanoyl-CoA dioxygenase family)
MDDWFATISAVDPLAPDTAGALADAGFAVIPGPVAPGAVPGQANAYDAAMAAAAETPDYRDGTTTTRLFDLVNRGPAFDSLYLHPPLLQAAARVIGGPFRLSILLARTLRPGTAAQGLHADVPRDDPARPMVGFIFMVDPFRPDNGATRLVPGSHRWPQVPEAVLPDPDAPCAGEVLACGPAGALLVFDASVWHGHTVNASGAPRRSIQGYFIPRDAPSGFDLRSRMRPETLARLGPLAKYLLALD